MTTMVPLPQLAAGPGIPSPSHGTWYLWVIPVGAYASLIITGIFVGGYVGGALGALGPTHRPAEPTPAVRRRRVRGGRDHGAVAQRPASP